MTEERFDVKLELEEGYAFDVDFDHDGVATLRMDEPPPLGEGQGPNATRLLAAAVGNCLSASILLCLTKARVQVDGMRTTVRTSLVRNEKGRLRVGRIQVAIHPELGEDDPERAKRCLELFEDFCIVTESVRAGVDVGVTVTLDAPVPPLMVEEP